jgi:hypothetical protein
MSNSRFVLVGFGVVAAGFLASCSSSSDTCGSIQASDYDRSCSTASDCIGVPEGDSCKGIFCRDCIDAAINVSAEARYAADFKSTVGATVVCPCPIGQSVTCDAGVCSVDDY